MNRAARIAAKAQAGQVWASKAAWEQASEERDEARDREELDARPLGAMALKGVPEPVEVVQCVMGKRGGG